MKKFIISEDERSRILSMHVSATKRQYLSEQTESIPSSINDLRDLEEKTVNFYSDKENNKLLQNFSPSTIKLFTKNSKGELVMEYWLPNKGGQNSGLKKVI